MIVFLSGPMTGLPDFNRPAFNEYASKLEELGHIVINPAVHPLGLTHDQYMTLCLPGVKVAECVAQLPGWRRSKGAMMEYELAKLLNRKIIDVRRLTGGERR